MIKRAKRLALDLFKEIKDSYSPNKKNKDKDANEEGDDIPPCNNQQNKKLRNSTSEKNLPPKPKRTPSFSSKKKGETSNSLPLPLNADPSWPAKRERSPTDPDAPSTIKSKGKPLRAKSETGLNRSPSRDKLTRSNSKDKISRDFLSRKRSIWKKKADVERESTKETGVLEVLSVGSAPDMLTPLDANTFQVSFSVDNIDAYLAERLEGPMSQCMWQQLKVERGETQAMEERAHKKGKEDQFSKPKEAGGEDSFSKHILFCDTMMAREIAAVCAQLDDQKRELLAEILLREGPLPAQESAPPCKDSLAPPRSGSLRKGNHARKGSIVAFNSTVEVLELGQDGSKLKSSAELCEQPRPRPLSRKMRSRMPSPLTIPSESSSPSPVPSPFSSPRIFVSHTPSPTVSPIVSPRDPLPSPTLSPIFPSPRFPPSPLASPRPNSSPFASPRPNSSPFASPRTPTSPASPFPSPLSDSLSSPRESPPPSPTTQSRRSVDGASSKPKAPLRAWARVFSGRASKTRSDEVDPWVVARAMEEEISQVVVRCANEKLELLEEIELREISEASARLDAERSELLAEIARRENETQSARIARDAKEMGETQRCSPQQEKRHAMRLRMTIARRAAKGMDEAMQKAQDEQMAREIQEFSATNNVVKLGAGGAYVKRPSSRRLRRNVESSRNASLRAASRNAARKNLWIAEVPQAKVPENIGHP